MELRREFLLPAIVLAVIATTATAQDEAESAEKTNQCLACHANEDVWEGDTLHLLVTAENLQADVHFQRGIQCADCHGGNPNTYSLREAHAIEDGFRPIKSPAEIPVLCGQCHSNLEYMHRFNPSIQSDPVADFWTGVHGQYLRNSASAEPATGEGPTDTEAVEADALESEAGTESAENEGEPAEPATEESAAEPDSAESTQIEGRQADATEPSRMPNCLACHPTHNMRPADDPLSSVHPTRLVETCGSCHRDQLTAMRKGVHHSVGERTELGTGTPLDCLRCHGRNVHGMLPVKDAQSPVFLDHQVALCGSCHEEYLATYESSMHGHGLRQSGLLVTAVCADCHGAHEIYYAADRRSKLHRLNVAQTCGKCHRYIEERLNRSIHAQSAAATEPIDASTGSSPRKPKPGCVDCHQGHDEPRHLEAGYRLRLPNRCGNCHADLLLGYNVSMHGQLTRLGYEPAAKCSDCHGAHDTLAVKDPNGRLGSENRVQTCRQCHEYAVANFAQFNPHANHKDEARFPHLHHVYARIDAFIYLFFLVFLLHAILWYARSLLSTLRFGRHKTLVTQQMAVIRFTPVERAGYALLIVSLMGLISTGLPLKYSGQPWAERMVKALGGFQSTSVCHHFFAVLLLTTCGAHLWFVIRRMMRLRAQGAPWSQLLFGPDSMLLNRRDVRDIVAMIRWFFGMGPKPQFERWTYWEKFDYWAVYLVAAVIGCSGLLLWLPNFFCRMLPGESLNVASVVHSETALLGTGLLLIIHLFNAHLRPEKFPVDLSLVTGMVSEQHLQQARPEYLDRLRNENRLELVTVPPRRQMNVLVLSVYFLLMLGLLLLAWILLASLGK